MTYEYLCTACGHAWEAEQSISAAPLKTCPNCHQETARRQISGGAGFILKGGGWYSDLYSSAPKKSGGESTTKSESSSSDSGSKSDSSSKKDGTSSDKGSSGSSGSSSSSSGTPTSGTPSGSKATSAASGA